MLNIEKFRLRRLPTRPKTFQLTLACLFVIVLCHTGESTVVINEFIASNGSTLADEDGDHGDWIELHNRGDDAVMLHGWALSDDPERPFRWRFPPVSIPGDGYLLVWATGKDRSDPAEPLHTNFSIASAGEPLRLSRIDGSVADEVGPVALPRDISYGRGPGEEADRWFYFENPTPGAKNNSQTYKDLLEPPTVTFTTEPDGGGATVTISHPRQSVSVFYTVDGSQPDENSAVYDSPFRIEQPEPVEDGLAWIPTSPPEMADHGFEWAPPAGPIERVPVIRAQAFKQDYLAPFPTSATWIPKDMWANRIKGGLVSITLDADDLFDSVEGIYVPGMIYEKRGFNHRDAAGRPNANYHQRGSKWDRTAHIEYFAANESTAGISGVVGMRIHGATTRALPQKSLRIYDREAYGSERLLRTTPFFGGNSAPSLLSTLILRNSGNDLGMTHFRCALAQQIVRHLRFHTQDYAPVSLFINGDYWGIHNLRNRLGNEWLGAAHGISSEKIDRISFEMRVVAEAGDLDAYEKVIEYLEENDVAAPETMDWIEARIDIGNHIDYHIAQIFLGNRDWGGNNVDIWRMRTKGPRPASVAPFDGRLRWMMADLDFSLGQGSTWWFVDENMIQFATEEGRTGWPNPDWSTFLFRTLLQSPAYRNAFVTRFADLLNSAFLPERNLMFLDEFTKRIAPEMPSQVNRWNFPKSMDHWHDYVSDIAEFLERRPAYQWDHLRDFFGLGPLVEVSVMVDEASGGYTRVNSLDLRPHTVGMETFEGGLWSGLYPTEHTIEVEAVPHPGYRFAGWSDDPGATSVRRIDLTTDMSLEPRFSSYPASLPDKPHPLVEGPYTFGDLSSEKSPGTHPPSVRFPLISERDPRLNSILEENIWNFPYDLTNRSRVVGLGDDGVAFINTANPQNLPDAGYIMGALLALDTRGVDSVYVGWTAGTVRPNDREYALRLQYRVGANGPFRDVVDADGQPVEYIRADSSGHTATFPPIPLPPDALGVPYVELLWRYY